MGKMGFIARCGGRGNRIARLLWSYFSLRRISGAIWRLGVNPLPVDRGL